MKQMWAQMLSSFYMLDILLDTSCCHVGNSLVSAIWRLLNKWYFVLCMFCVVYPGGVWRLLRALFVGVHWGLKYHNFRYSRLWHHEMKWPVTLHVCFSDKFQKILKIVSYQFYVAGLTTEPYCSKNENQGFNICW